MAETEYEIKPVSGFSFGLKELWEYKELLYYFTWRDIKVKYKQTLLGVLWVILQPLALMLIFTFLLGAKFKSDLGNVPFPVFVLSGFLCWNIFSSAINSAGNSMVSNASIIKKIYFPRLIIPVSSVLGAFVDFFFGIFFYGAALFYFGVQVDAAQLLFIPLSLLLVFFAAFGTGTLISALNVKYRDFRYMLPFMVQALLFLSPVFFPARKGTGIADYIFSFNPMYAPLELFRAHLHGYAVNFELVVLSIAVNLLLLVAGIFVFRKTERYFADLA